MNGLERTLAFIEGEDVDHPPFHPIIMRWAAKYSGIKYRDFCLDPKAKCKAMIECARDFDIDWVTVMSDPWTEASAFGILLDYPENDLPVDVGGHFKDAESVANLAPYNPLESKRCINRIAEIEEFKRELGNSYFITGWVEGPMAEYVDLRKASEASTDLYLYPDHVEKAMDVIVEGAKRFIELQIEKGAHCIGIGDSFCSQIGPDLYNQFVFSRQKEMVDHIHSHGALAKLHICGNTSLILPYMIQTGADIIDIDHLVPSIEPFAHLPGKHQVFAGKSDPVTTIQNGNQSRIHESVKADYKAAIGRCIVSAGCEITPDTTTENMHAFKSSAISLGNKNSH